MMIMMMIISLLDFFLFFTSFLVPNWIHGDQSEQHSNNFDQFALLRFLPFRAVGNREEKTTHKPIAAIMSDLERLLFIVFRSRHAVPADLWRLFSTMARIHQYPTYRFFEDCCWSRVPTTTIVSNMREIHTDYHGTLNAGYWGESNEITPL